MGEPRQLVPLGEVLIKSSETTPIHPDRTYSEVTVRMWGNGVVLRRVATGAEIAAHRRAVVHAGEFILSRIDARNGAFGIVPASLDGAVVSNDFPSFGAVEGRLATSYLGWLSKTAGFVDLCRRASEGTTNRVRLKEALFLRMPIPLPPIDEQRRIVARVEAIAAQVGEAQRLRRAAEEEVALAHTRTVDSLLKGGQWPRRSLKTLLREPSRNGLSAHPSPSPPGHQILRISAATSRPDARVDENDVRYLDIDEWEAAKYRLTAGDLLACRFNGNLRFVGRFALYEGQTGQAQVYPDKLIRFRVDELRVCPRFVTYAMNCGRGRRLIEDLCATTAGNIGISAGRLQEVSLPLPPLSEQERIVEEIEHIEASLYGVGRTQEQTKREIEALLPAVLDRAFKGEL